MEESNKKFNDESEWIVVENTHEAIIDKDTFNKLIEGAYYSPSAQNEQDVEFVVLDKKLNDFMKHVYDIINVQEDEFFRLNHPIL